MAVCVGVGRYVLMCISIRSCRAVEGLVQIALKVESQEVKVKVPRKV
jgi:hypothetical protein